MRIKTYSILIAFVVVFLSCSKDEDFIIISPVDIRFVHEDGSDIGINECISPNEKYGVKITTNSLGNGKYKVIEINYTINGNVRSMTFLQEGSQIDPVTLIDGMNTVQIVESGYTSNLYYVEQDDFQLVE
jgi:hypothetical protein